MSHPVENSAIVVVSGLPRSGTSMMMRMLEAGGMHPLTDHERRADEDNPKGYYEFERVKTLRDDKSWLPQAVGKAVKIISFLLPELPDCFQYRVVFMRRALPEILASQAKMLERRAEENRGDDARMAELYEKHLRHVTAWLARQPNFEVLCVDHRDAITSPDLAAHQVCHFLGGSLDAAAMAQAIDPALHRNRI